MRDPEFIANLSPSSGKSPTTFCSSKIVHRPDSGFELISDPEPSPKLYDLKTQLEMPKDALMIYLTARGNIFGLRWQYYYLQYVGIVIEQAAQPESSPLLRVSDLDGNEIGQAQLWYQRASTIHSPVYCDIRWHPTQGEKVNLTNAESASRWTEIRAAWRGRRLLQNVKKVGRPEYSASLTQAQFMQRAPQVCARLMKTFDEMPTDVQIAEGLGISRATLYRYLEREGLKVSHLRDMAVGIIIEPSPF